MIITPDPLIKFREKVRQAYLEIMFWVERESSISLIFWIVVLILFLVARGLR